MVNYNAVQKQIQLLRPSHIECRENTLCVAIVPHDRGLNERFSASDLMWVKCPKTKQIKVLIDAYARSKRRPQGPVLNLLHNGYVLDPTAPAAILQDGDKVVVLHAADGSNSPIEIDDNPIESQTVGRRTASTHSIPPLSPSLERTASTPLLDQWSPTDPSSAFPFTQQHTKTLSDHTLSWVDFVFARRALRTRRYGLAGEDAQETSIMNQQWLNFSAGQRQSLDIRALELNIENITRRRAFWQHYADGLDDSSTAFDHSFFDPIKFDEALATWQSSSPNYRQKVTLAIKQIPGTCEIPPEPDKAAGVALSETDSDHALGDVEDDETTGDRPETDEVQRFAEALQTAEGEAQAVTTRFNINDLFTEASTALYEQGVRKGMEILSSLKTILNGAHGSPDAEEWLTMIKRIELQAEKTRTIIGVVGATGAGKSSVINAMLDEERLLPTNCMRACTAVVTEISYNSQNDLYRAEIEFVSQEDWRKELKILYQELLDSNGNVAKEAVMSEDSEAGVAYAKLKAVYPHLTREMMAQATPDRLMEHKNVNVLGTVKKLESESASDFYQSLQRYVDSKEKVKKQGKVSSEAKSVLSVEYWPLIKVVRLYVKSPALETGAVIVDLPGVHDSNQARAAVAQRYMKECTGLWIVAPITRAVDDKSAKTLLGETFKRQLKIDGAYNSVTFICSKTDDISMTEAIDSLQLDEKLQSAYEKIQELTQARKKIQQQLDRQRDALEDITVAVDKADDDVETWENILSKCQEGETVYAPATKKRKKKAPSKAQKRSKYSDPDSDDDFVLSDASSSSDEDKLDDDDDYEDDEDENCERVTEKLALAKVEEFRSVKKEGRRRKVEIETEIKGLRKQMLVNKQEQEASDAIISHECISGRNNYSRTAIKQDFAAGIKELDQEIAEEEDAANFNPDEDIRDYDEVAKSLPVFCVSSRGYQKLMGRLKKDKPVLGFETVDQTEIPALQHHCSKLTESNREAACKRFLNSLSTLLNSLRLWSSSDGTNANLTDEQTQREKKILEDKLGKLDSALEKQVRSIQTNIKDELEDNLYGVFTTAIEAAKNQANATVSKWSRPYNRNDANASGLHYSTYKAVCRRNGVYTNAFLGLLHFNEQLTEPIIKHIANGWERTFQRRIPGTLTTLVSAIDKMLNTFHDEVEKRATKNGGNLGRYLMLRHGLANYREVVKDTTNRTKLTISSRQRDINREFVPVVTTAMMPVYDVCTAERGPGSFRRMKLAMEQHVDREKNDMFAKAADSVRGLITVMLKDIQAELEASLDEIFLSMKRDYIQLVTGINAANEERLPREQRKMRKEVLDVIEGARLAFDRVVGLAPPSPPPEQRQIASTEADDEVLNPPEADVDKNQSSFDKELQENAYPNPDKNGAIQSNTPAEGRSPLHSNDANMVEQDTDNTLDRVFAMSSASSVESDMEQQNKQVTNRGEALQQPENGTTADKRHEDLGDEGLSDFLEPHQSKRDSERTGGQLYGQNIDYNPLGDFQKYPSALHYPGKENAVSNDWHDNGYSSD